MDLLWNMDLINAIIDPVDIPFIRSMPISTTFRPYSLGWYYTKTGRYTVKSGYLLEQERNRERPLSYRPGIQSLQTYTWKLKCPPKIRQFA